VFQAAAPGLRVGALLDHVRPTSYDTAGARLDGVALPALALPGLPFRLEPGRGAVALQVSFRGDTVRARWSLRSDAVAWRRDSLLARGGDVERVVGRVLQGVRALEVEAELRGTLAAPRLAVRSNLDRALAAALREVLGEAVAAAERRLRAEVDRLVEPRSAPVRVRAAELEREVETRMAEHTRRIEQVQRDLEQRLREVTRGIRLP
jgi:hypothetical protein